MNWGPFHSKGPQGPTQGVSMSRVVAFIFTLTYCAALLLSARTTATGMGWPFAALGIIVVMAVPLQALFATLQSWLATAPGKRLIETLITKVAAVATNAIAASTTTTTTTAPATPLVIPDRGDKVS